MIKWDNFWLKWCRGNYWKVTKSQYRVWPPFAARTARHRRLMERMSTQTTRIGILRHSSCNRKTFCTKSGVGSQEVIKEFCPLCHIQTVCIWEAHWVGYRMLFQKSSIMCQPVAFIQDFSAVIYHRYQLSFTTVFFHDCMLPIWQETLFFKVIYDVEYTMCSSNLQRIHINETGR